MRSMVEERREAALSHGEADLHAFGAAPLPPAFGRRSPSPSKLGEDLFARTAVRLAGMVGVMFGWSPAAFWSATPAELAALVAALQGEDAAPLDGAMLARLKEAFPDG